MRNTLDCLKIKFWIIRSLYKEKERHNRLLKKPKYQYKKYRSIKRLEKEL